jgi:hypothetical protein
VDLDACAGEESVLAARILIILSLQIDSPVELHDGHASQSSRCCCFGIIVLDRLRVCSFIRQCHHTIDAGVKVLHLLRWNCICFRIFHKTVHADHKLSGRKDHLLRLDVQRPDLDRVLTGLRIHTAIVTYSVVVGHLWIARRESRIVGRYGWRLQLVSIPALQ